MFRMMKTGICLVFAGCAAIVGCGPKAGDTRTIVLPGGARMEMVWCPATTSEEWKRISGGKDFFWMGSPLTEDERGDDESRHRVKLTEGFWIGKYEVTQSQWESVMENNPYVYHSSYKGANRPVGGVSWEECQEFIDIINEAGKVAVAFPTEEQWEYACRAGTRTPFSFGTTWSSDQANMFDWKVGAKDVGSYKPNAWGIYDMHGNVYEWCLDEYTDKWGSGHIVRGGRSAERDDYSSGAWDFIGFRLVAP